MDFGRIFTLVLTALGVSVGWFNPVMGLMVYTAFSLLRPSALWFWSFTGAERYTMLVAASTLIGWGISGFGGGAAIRPVAVPMFGLGLYLLNGFMAAKFWSISQVRAMESWTVQFKIGLMCLVTLMIVREAKHIRTYAWVLTACLGYLAYVFNSQYVFDGWNRIYFRGFGGVDNNGVGMIMVMGVPLCFFMGIHDKRTWVRALCLFGAICLVHVVLFSFSRGAQLGLCMVGFALFWVALFKLPNKMLTLVLALVFVLITLRLAGAEVREEFWSIFVDAEERDASAASRFDTWSGAWACMLDNPLGVGPRNFNLVSHNYGLSKNKSVHNLMLQTGADYGIPGMLGLVTFYVGTMWQTWRMAGSRTAGRHVWPRYFGHMVFISLGGFLVCSTFIGMESVDAGYIIALLGLCTVSFVHRMGSAEPVEATHQLPELQEVPAPGEYEPALAYSRG
jgi:hypothetical protein